MTEPVIPVTSNTINQSAPYNQKAVWSLVLGILSIICCGIFTGIPGWILAVIAKKEIRSTGEQGDGMATAGLITSIVGVGLMILAIVAYVIIFVVFSAVFSSFIRGIPA